MDCCQGQKTTRDTSNTDIGYVMFDNVFNPCTMLITYVFGSDSGFFLISTQLQILYRIHSNWNPAGFHLTLPGSFDTSTGHHIPTPRPYLDTLRIYNIAISRDGMKRQPLGSVCRLGMRKKFHVAEKLDYVCFSRAVCSARRANQTVVKDILINLSLSGLFLERKLI